MISCCLLLYTAFVTPVTVAFFWDKEFCEPMPTLPFDMFLDTFFLVEILYTFFLAVHSEGEYIDTVPQVAWHYFRSGSLFFDMLTSIPVALIEFAWMQSTCGQAAEEVSASGATVGLRFVRIIKPLRLLKLLRVVKTMKILEFMDWLEAACRPPPLLFRMMRITFIMTMIIHLCACAWWLTKALSSGIDTYPQLDLELDAPLWRKYILSVYFINTIFTTVGFGDISAENPAEQIFCVIIMYIGVLVFGTLLAEVQTVVGELRRSTREKNQIRQQLMWYLRKKDVPSALEYKVMRWLDFSIECKQDAHTEGLCLSHIPASMQAEVMYYVYGNLLASVDLFSQEGCEWPSDEERVHVLRSMVTSLQCETFCDQEELFRSVNGYTNPPKGLYIVVEGEVTEYCRGVRTTVHKPGDFFGEQALLAAAASQVAVGDPALGMPLLVAKSHVRCVLLPTAAFEDVFQPRPIMRRRIQGHILERCRQLGASHSRLRWMRLVSRLRRMHRLQQAPSGNLSQPGSPQGSTTLSFLSENERSDLLGAAAGMHHRPRRCSSGGGSGRGADPALASVEEETREHPKALRAPPPGDRWHHPAGAAGRLPPSPSQSFAGGMPVMASPSPALAAAARQYSTNTDHLALPQPAMGGPFRTCEPAPPSRARPAPLPVRDGAAQARFMEPVDELSVDVAVRSEGAEEEWSAEKTRRGSGEPADGRNEPASAGSAGSSDVSALYETVMALKEVVEEESRAMRLFREEVRESLQELAFRSPWT